MDWMKITSALFLLAMIVFLFPRMRDAVKNSPKGSMNDWMGYLIPLVAVIGFIILLINMV